jgi:hypothetical protein
MSEKTVLISLAGRKYYYYYYYTTTATTTLASDQKQPAARQPVLFLLELLRSLFVLLFNRS